MNIVWFKKDLRVTDHGPLFKASQLGKTVGLYIIEPDWIKSPEYSNHHLQFLVDSLVQLEKDLIAYNIPLIILKGDTLDVLKSLKEKLNFKNLLSHRETGLWWTYQRDLKVKSWCKDNSIQWSEWDQFAILRGLKNRDLWNAKRIQIINRKPYSEPRPLKLKPQSQIDVGTSLAELKSQNQDFKNEILKTFNDQNLKPESLVDRRNTYLQVGGRKPAEQLLKSFLSERVLNYQKGMSSPRTAMEDCSRLSPHIAWGTMSLTEITYRIAKEKSKLDPFDPEVKKWFRNVKSFESRLWWHCHFIQKLESEPEIEFKNMNSGFDGMRENDFNPAFFEAWSKGETGFPIIDACMRCLIQTGWINFRMRALLISFSSYQLWLHWKKPAEHLARLFTDFEPGIHYSQIQMQSGVTGINTIRMYSAIKQSLDQDPTGEFIKRYCPELEGLDESSIHQPQLTPPMLQTMSGVIIGRDYPKPIVDHKIAYSLAKEKVYGWRSSSAVKTEAKQVYQKHGSRKNSFFPTQHRKPFGNFNTK